MITMGQHTAGTAPSTLAVLPPGPANIVVANAGSVTTYVGVLGGGGTISTANGFPCPANSWPVAFPVYPGSAGGSLSAITASGSASLGYVISTP